MLKTLIRFAKLGEFVPTAFNGKRCLINLAEANTEHVNYNVDSIYKNEEGQHFAWVSLIGSYSWSEVILIPIHTEKEIEETLLGFLPVTPLESDTDEMVEELFHIIKTAPSFVIDEYLSWVNRFKEYPNLQESILFFKEHTFSEMPF